MVEGGFVDAKKFEEARGVAEEERVDLENVLIDRNLISDEHLGQLIAVDKNVQFVDLRTQGVDRNLLTVIPEEVARTQEVLLFGRAGSKLKLAMHRPDDFTFVSFIEKKMGKEVVPFFATKRDLEEAFDVYRKSLGEKYQELIEQSVKEAAGGKKIKEYPIVQIVDVLLEYAQNNKASDLHFEPRKEYTSVRFRIDGVLHNVLKLPIELHDAVITRIKVLAELRTDEHFAAQDGKINYEIENEEYDVRVSIVPITSGEKAVLRFLSETTKDYTLSTLGFAKHDFGKLNDAIRKPWGMVLATGPTGSGKTTTLYSVLKVLNSPDVNISSIEDPVEYDIENANQIQVNNRTNLTFAKGLKSIVRQDPDIIMVGEIRDEETAGIAVNSAMTGHLVLSSLHTNDAATTLPRLLDMDIEPFLIASTVNVALAQRLVRKICLRCRESDELSAKQTKEIMGQFDKRIQGVLKKQMSGTKLLVYKGAGCAVCQDTGYVGRIGIFEVLEVSETIKSLIMKRANADEIKKQAVKEGMTTMIEDGIRKVMAGVTTIEEVLRVARS